MFSGRWVEIEYMGRGYHKAPQSVRNHGISYCIALSTFFTNIQFVSVMSLEREFTESDIQTIVILTPLVFLKLKCSVEQHTEANLFTEVLKVSTGNEIGVCSKNTEILIPYP